jgi:hypothetical protein
MPDRFGNTLCCPSLEEPMAVAIFANGVYETDTVAGILRFAMLRSQRFEA